MSKYLSDFFVFKVLRFGSYVVNAYINFLASYLIVASTGEGSLLTAKQKLTIEKFNEVWKYFINENKWPKIECQRRIQMQLINIVPTCAKLYIFIPYIMIYY